MTILTDAKKSILSTHDGVFKSSFPHDVMLCSKDGCTPDEMITKAVQNKRDRAPIAYRSGGCSIINGKIVP